MCCWCLRVYWTVLHNLFVRFVTHVAESICNNNYFSCCPCYCCCCDRCREYKQTNRASPILMDHAEAESSFGGMEQANSATIRQQHDYVIVDDIDANYLQIERRKIETEAYYLTVDRATAEDILQCREDGSCLVRPFKETDISIKYIVSIYAQEQYFHLFIRQIDGRECYGIGQEKLNEKHFHTPSDIIDFYSYNALLCTNKNISISLFLKPIVV